MVYVVTREVSNDWASPFHGGAPALSKFVNGRTRTARWKLSAPLQAEPSLTLATISTIVSRRFSGCLVHFSIRSRKTTNTK